MGARTFLPRRSKTAGQILLLFTVSFVLLILFVGMVVDGGLVYGKRAELNKGVDAAAMAAITHLSHGQGQAKQIARDMFAANYRSGARDAQPPDLTVQFSVDASNNTTVDVSATAYLRPFFLQVLPQFDVFPVGSSAQALRSKLVLSLVLDRSGSMQGNQGCAALGPAVDTFVNFFDDAQDRFALVTYASHARVDVPMVSPFKGRVKALTPRKCASDFFGFTFLDGGLELAYQQNQSVVILPGEQVAKVVVFFTDGLANTFQESFLCPPQKTWNLSSGDSGNTVHLIDPATGIELCQSTPQPGDPLPCCPGLSTFPSVLGGFRSAVGPQAGNDVRQEAKDRALARATRIRQAGSNVYTIGLGAGADQAFLMEMANDPNSPSFDPSEPVGEFIYAPTAAQLQSVFQTLAKKILLRLSR